MVQATIETKLWHRNTIDTNKQKQHTEKHNEIRQKLNIETADSNGIQGFYLGVNGGYY